ncbi:MAG: hypothetical protein ACLS43_01715 [Evtepia gabavorous]
MIYFDHAATTRVLPEAAQAAMKTMTEDYGNPSSLYQLGSRPPRMGSTGTGGPGLGLSGEEVYFTSEEPRGQLPLPWRSIWAATRASTSSHGDRARRGASALQGLERQGYEVTYLHPDASGRVRVRTRGRPPAGHRAGVHDAGEQ